MTLPADSLRQGWLPMLGLFANDHVPVMEALLGQVARHLGEFKSQNFQGLEEPDGYDGVHNRGPVSRLLVSEWAVLDQLPDEFFRRVVANELLYLRPKQIENRAGRSCRVVVDCGPHMLGVPRLLQLACLILLAARAERADARFAWVSAQQPELGLRPLKTEDDFKQLLAAGCAELLQPSHWESLAGLEKNPEHPLEAGETQTLGESATAHRQNETWWLGHAAFAASAAPLCQRQLNITYPEAATLHLTIAQGGAHPRTLRLKTPDEKDSVALLRRPFQAASAFRERVHDETVPLTQLNKQLAANTALRFSADGRRIALQTADGQGLIFPIPNSPRAKAGKPRVIRKPDDAQFRAIAFDGKKPVSLWQNDKGELLLGMQRQTLNLGGDLLDPFIGDCLAPMYLSRSKARLVITISGKIVVINLNTFSVTDEGLGDVTAVQVGTNLIHYCQHDRANRKLVIGKINSGLHNPANGAARSERLATHHCQLGTTGQCLFGGQNMTRSNAYYAVQTSTHYCQLVSPDKKAQIKLANGDELAGLFPVYQNRASLVVVDARGELVMIEGSKRRQISLPLTRICGHAFDPANWQLMLIDQNRNLLQYCLKHSEIVARFGNEEDE